MILWGEPADSQNLHIKLFRAFCLPDCSVFTAVFRKNTLVTSIWDAQKRHSEPVFKGEV